MAPGAVEFDAPIPELRKSLDTDATHLAVGVLVFDSTGNVLLIQRSASDSMASKWEIPGGGCDPEDLSVLFSVARELEEETGLRARRILRIVGNGHRFLSSKGLKILKLTFEVDLDRTETDDINESAAIIVRLDTKEHQNHVWASEEEVARGKAGDTTLEFTKKEQKAVILEAFASRKAEAKDQR